MPFVPPATTSYNLSFGLRRTYTGALASVHQGLITERRLEGHPEVTAANSGRIVIARDMSLKVASL